MKLNNIMSVIYMVGHILRTYNGIKVDSKRIQIIKLIQFIDR